MNTSSETNETSTQDWVTFKELFLQKPEILKELKSHPLPLGINETAFHVDVENKEITKIEIPEEHRRHVIKSYVVRPMLINFLNKPYSLVVFSIFPNIEKQYENIFGGFTIDEKMVVDNNGKLINNKLAFLNNAIFIFIETPTKKISNPEMYLKEFEEIVEFKEVYELEKCLEKNPDAFLQINEYETK